MIDRVYKLIQTISNNELNGNISPQEYNLLLSNSVTEIYESNLYELNRAVYRERRGQSNQFSIENLAGKFREKIMHYYTHSSESIPVTLPVNSRYLDTVEYMGNSVEPTTNRRHFNSIVNFPDTAPNESNPIYLKVGSSLTIAPTLTGSVDLYYLRAPLTAKWTYFVVNGTEIFNHDADDFKDIDIHSSEEYSLTIKLLQKLGVNLKDQQLMDYGITKEQIDFEQEKVYN